jgi:hypothetical protein
MNNWVKFAINAAEIPEQFTNIDMAKSDVHKIEDQILVYVSECDAPPTTDVPACISFTQALLDKMPGKPCVHLAFSFALMVVGCLQGIDLVRMEQAKAKKH